MRNVGEPPTLHWVGFQAAFVYRVRQPENGFVVFSGCASVNVGGGIDLFALSRRATYFLCFAKESKQRKATPTCRSASQTSLTPHPFFGAYELVALRAPSDKRTLFPEKRMLRSAGRRGHALAPNVGDGLTKKGSLKI